MNLAAPPRRVPTSLLPLALLAVVWAAPAAPAGEYRDPEGRFTVAVPAGFQLVDRSILEAKLVELRRAGANVPSYQAAFDRGVEPRLSYPYALVEVTPSEGTGWTADDLKDLLPTGNLERTAQETAAVFDRLGLGSLLRDPRITFVRWEPERQAAVYRITTRVGGAEVRGTGRISFYRNGYITLWFYYVAGTPYADTAEGFAAALTVLPAHRVPLSGSRAGARTVLILATVAAAGGVVGIAAWLARRRRRAAALLALLVAFSLNACAPRPGAVRTVEPGSLRCAPSGYGTVACY